MGTQRPGVVVPAIAPLYGCYLLIFGLPKDSYEAGEFWTAIISLLWGYGPIAFVAARHYLKTRNTSG